MYDKCLFSELSYTLEVGIEKFILLNQWLNLGHPYTYSLLSDISSLIYCTDIN